MIITQTELFVQRFTYPAYVPKDIDLLTKLISLTEIMRLFQSDLMTYKRFREIPYLFICVIFKPAKFVLNFNKKYMTLVSL